MKLIDQPRPTDDLAEFGQLLSFRALVYENDDEGEANGPFVSYNMDCSVFFPRDPKEANEVFDAILVSLEAAEQQFIDDGEEEGFVALFDTEKGLMILSGTNLMGYDIPDFDSEIKQYVGMPHTTWERILEDMF